ncbi:hypothetical protein ACIA78_29570 [Streptomyces xanthochromogenes]|uniref:hypothetical protein n=1 Tax=Streptomyces xanthochromogenes TaxID=67384 RepID=UPI00378BBCA2
MSFIRSTTGVIVAGIFAAGILTVGATGIAHADDAPTTPTGVTAPAPSPSPTTTVSPGENPWN